MSNPLPERCPVCGVPFDAVVQRGREPGDYYVRFYCSRACAGQARRRRVQLTCEECGAAFSVPRFYAQASYARRRRFCSVPCRQAALRRHPPNPLKGRKLLNGYVLLYRPDHPQAAHGGYVPEHRLVMEEKLGRLLASKERVHHINHEKADNRPDNLLLFSGDSAHTRHH